MLVAWWTPTEDTIQKLIEWFRNKSTDWNQLYALLGSMEKWIKKASEWVEIRNFIHSELLNSPWPPWASLWPVIWAHEVEASNKSGCSISDGKEPEWIPYWSWLQAFCWQLWLVELSSAGSLWSGECNKQQFCLLWGLSVAHTRILGQEWIFSRTRGESKFLILVFVFLDAQTQ